MGKLILYSLLAGAVGTGLGALIAVLLKRQDKTFMTYLLNFAGGMMISITCFKLIPEAFELSNIYVTTAGVLLGVILIQVLNKYIDHIQAKKDCHVELDELIHADEFVKEARHKKEHRLRGEMSDDCMFRAGLIMLFAIALHNLPEGLAIGATGSYNERIGLILAITIAFHNVPEGMAISVPLTMGGLSKSKTIIWTAASGLPTVIGAIIGALIGNISEEVAGLTLALAGGAMIYVTFGEIMPQAIKMCNNKKTVGFTLIGFIIGMVVMFVT